MHLPHFNPASVLLISLLSILYALAVDARVIVITQAPKCYDKDGKRIVCRNSKLRTIIGLSVAGGILLLVGLYWLIKTLLPKWRAHRATRSYTQVPEVQTSAPVSVGNHYVNELPYNSNPTSGYQPAYDPPSYAFPTPAPDTEKKNEPL